MTLTKNQFFFIAVLLLLSAFFLRKVFWVINARKTTGKVWFTGHGNLGSSLGMSTYQVIRFIAGNDTIIFNSNLDLGFKDGENINVLYEPNDPKDAKVDSFNSIWGDSLAYSLAPFLLLVIFYIMPDIIPKNAKIQLGGRRVMRISKPVTDSSL